MAFRIAGFLAKDSERKMTRTLAKETLAVVLVRKLVMNNPEEPSSGPSTEIGRMSTPFLVSTGITVRWWQLWDIEEGG